MAVPDYRRFSLVVKINRSELEALKRLAEAEHLPRTHVVRRLIWHAAKSLERGERFQEVRDDP